MNATENIELIKEIILKNINLAGLTYESDFYDEPDGGYCYSITTKYANGLISDAPDGILKMYVFNNQMYNWAIREGLSDEQIEELRLYKVALSVDDLISYLTTQKLKPID